MIDEENKTGKSKELVKTIIKKTNIKRGKKMDKKMENETEKRFNLFKQTDYTKIDIKPLRELYKSFCKDYLYYETETNNYYFKTSIREFDLILEEFENHIFNKLSEVKKK